MQALLYKYLAQTGKVSIEELGTFSILHNSPHYHTVAAQYMAPTQQICFKNDPCKTTEAFIDYVAVQKNSTFSGAKEMIAAEISTVKQLLAQNGFDEWKGIGVIKKHSDGAIALVPAEIPACHQKINATRVIRKEATHAITVGEQERTNIQMEEYYMETAATPKNRWWIAALCIGVATIAYLAYYYVIHRSFS